MIKKIRTPLNFKIASYCRNFIGLTMLIILLALGGVPKMIATDTIKISDWEYDTVWTGYENHAVNTLSGWSTTEGRTT